MALVLSLPIDALQPLAAGLDDTPDPQPRSNAPVVNSYDPSVEQWRDPLWQRMPDNLKQRPDAPVLLDKALHAVRGESGGDPNAVGDGGAAHGLFQSHYVGEGATPEQQIDDAWRLVGNRLASGGTGFEDWGENNTYQGQPFGAFGRTPYGGAQTGGWGLPAVASQVQNGPIAPNLIGDTSPYIPGNYGDVPYDAGQGPSFGGYGNTLLNQLPGRQGFAQESSGQLYTLGDNGETSDSPWGLAGRVYSAANVPIPYVTPAIENIVKPAVSSATDALIGGPGEVYNQTAGRLGAPHLPTVPDLLNRAGLPSPGDVAASAIPSRAADIALTALPFAGEAGDVARGGRGALERAATEGLGDELGQAPEAAATVEGRLAARGRVVPAGASDEPLNPDTLGVGGDEAAAQNATDFAEQARQRNAATANDLSNVPAPTTESGGLPIQQQAIDKLTANILLSDHVPEETEALRGQVRSQRAAQAYSAMQGEGTPEELARNARSAVFQRGEMPRANWTSPLTGLTDDERNALFDVLNQQQETLGPYKHASAVDALDKVFQGAYDTLTPSERRLLGTVYGPALDNAIGQQLQRSLGQMRLVDRLRYYGGRGLANLGDLINAPVSTATFGHFTNLRQGLGFALTHPSVAAQALRNQAAILRDPSLLEALRDGVHDNPWVEGTEFASDQAMKGIRAVDFITHNEQAQPTFVGNLLAKLGLKGNRFQQAGQMYLDSLRKLGYADEAQALWDSGERDPREYKALWDTISNATGHGATTKPTIMGINPAFSYNALAGKWKAMFDPLVQPGPALGAGARNVAIRNMLATAGAGGTALLLGDLSGAGSVNWNINGPAGLRLRVGASTIDPFGGYGSIVRFLARAEQAVQNGGSDPQGALTKVFDSTQAYLRGQISPGYQAVLQLLTGRDWSNRKITPGQTLHQLLGDSEPIAAKSLIEAFKANGPVGAAIAAPALGGVSVETPDSLTARRDIAAQKLGARDYASAGPEIQDQVNKSDDVASYVQEHPTDYESRRAEVMAPINAKEQQAFDAFNRGENTAKITDLLHTLSDYRQQAATDLGTQFASEFKGFDQNKYQKAVDGYYAKQATFADGSPDYDTTDKMRQQYLSSLPADQQQWLNEALKVTESNKSEGRRKYDQYIADKKAAGYFNIGKPADPDYQKKKNVLDAANPKLDAEAWLYGGTKGTSGGELQSKAAVDQVLGMKLPNRPVNFGTLDRDLSTPQGRAFWQQYGNDLNNLVSGAYSQKYGDQEAQREYQRKEVGSPRYDDLSASDKQKVDNAIRKSVLDGDPELDAIWTYAGGGGNSQDKVYVLHSSAAIPYIKKLYDQFGNAPPKEGWEIVGPKRG